MCESVNKHAYTRAFLPAPNMKFLCTPALSDYAFIREIEGGKQEPCTVVFFFFFFSQKCV